MGTLLFNMYLQSFCFIVLGSINTMIMMIKITNTIPPTTYLILDFEDDNFDEPLNGTFSSSTCIRVVIISLKATLVFFSFSYKKKEKEMIINMMIKVFKICYAKFEMEDSFRYFLFNLFKLWILQRFFNLQYKP